jgi:hypothetical protein
MRCASLPLALAGSLLVVQASARADVAKYYADDTQYILVVDLDKVRQSAAARHTLGGKSLVQFARDLVLDLKKQDPAAPEGFEALVGFVDRLSANTRRITVVPWSKGFLSPQEGGALVLCEGKYDGKQLLEDVKAAARAGKASVKVQKVGDHDIIRVTGKNGSYGLALLEPSVLAITTGDKQQAALEAAVSRASGQSRPNPETLFAVRLLKELPRGRAVAAGVSIAPTADGLTLGSSVVAVDLGETDVRLEATFIPVEEADARKLEPKLLATIRDAADSLAQAKLPLAGHVKAAKVARSGNRVTVKLAAPADAAADTLRTLVRRAAERPVIFPGLRGHVTSVAVSPDGKTVAAVTTHQNEGIFTTRVIGPGKLMVWDVATRRPVLEHSLGNAPGEKTYFGGTGLAFHPNSRLLAVATRSSDLGSARVVVVWDLQAKREVRRLAGDDAVLSPDGRYLAVRDSGGVTLVDTRTWNPLHHLAATGSCYQLAFAPNGSHLAGIFDEDGTPQKNRLLIWATGSGALVRTVQVPGRRLSDFAWDAGRRQAGALHRVGHHGPHLGLAAGGRNPQGPGRPVRHVPARRDEVRRGVRAGLGQGVRPGRRRNRYVAGAGPRHQLPGLPTQRPRAGRRYEVRESLPVVIEVRAP